MPHTHFAWPVAFHTTRASLLLGAGLAAALLAGCAGSRLVPTAMTKPETQLVVEARGESRVSGDRGNDRLGDPRAGVSFDFATPTWVPPGFHPIDAVSLPADADWVLLGWEQGAGDRIDLVISPHLPDLPDGPARVVTPVSVNGQPGLLMLGLSREDPEGWDPTLQTILAWQAGEVHYALAATGASATAYDLLRMAESLMN